MLMVGKCVITAINTSGDTSKVQINLLADTTQDDVDFWQHYGFTSAPPADTRALMVSVGGNQDHGVVIATENGKFRIKDLKPGETCIYSEWGDKIHFKENNVVDFKTKELNIKCAEKVNIDSPIVSISGDIESDSLKTNKDITAGGNVGASGEVSGSQVKDSSGSLGGLRLWSSTHVHTSAAPGSPTTPPVQPIPPN